MFFSGDGFMVVIAGSCMVSEHVLAKVLKSERVNVEHVLSVTCTRSRLGLHSKPSARTLLRLHSFCPSLSAIIDATRQLKFRFLPGRDDPSS